ncbi:hypothetical protein V1L52_03650 [Treponema sp. HNW]|uniref:hypothetical protein n=1 Tax=Treponema sp. HNW TaxID=3116654 RepID=UPI003D1034F5
MKINDKNFPLFPILSVFILVYLFSAVRISEKKLDIKPEWTIKIDENAVMEGPLTEKLIPFRMNNMMGYCTQEGSLVSLIPVEQNASISADFWALYGKNAENTKFFAPDNTEQGIIERAGFPFFTQNGIFVFHPGGASFSRHGERGETQWDYEYYAPLTAFSASEAGCTAGFADGNLVCMDTEGKIKARFYPGGSETEVIFGAALSQNGVYAACVSGLNPQRIVAAELEAGKAKIIYHDYLKEESAEQTLVRFSSDNKYVFFSGKSGLTSVRLADKKSFFIPFKGKILDIREFGAKDIFFVLSRDAHRYTVTVLCEGRYNKGAFSFQANSAFLYADRGCIYVGADDRISKMTLYFD